MRQKEHFPEYSLITRKAHKDGKRFQWKYFAIGIIITAVTIMAIMMYTNRTVKSVERALEIEPDSTNISVKFLAHADGTCPSNLTSCPPSTGIYSPECCPNAFPKSSEYCCPHGFPNCGDKTCCPSGYPIGCAGGLCCPEGTRCGDGTCLPGEIVTSNCTACSTCCSTKVGDLCCPFQNGVCCEDRINCCPGGYNCGQYKEFAACLPNNNSPTNEHVDDITISNALVGHNSNTTDQSYAFIPVSTGIKATCYEEASKIYCTYDEANAASVSCLMKQETGYCSVFPSNCWNISAVGGPCYPSQSGCETPTVGSCNWYLGCLQTKYHCALDDYPVSYGFYYCQKFLANLNKFDADGQKWIQNVLLCLQNALVPAYENKGNIVSSCRMLSDMAFETHPQCYTKSNPSFCQIAKNPENLITLFWDVYNVKDLITWRAIKQEITVLLDCSGNWKPILPRLPLVLFDE